MTDVIRFDDSPADDDFRSFFACVAIDTHPPFVTIDYSIRTNYYIHTK